jgi:hypothetical protein
MLVCIFRLIRAEADRNNRPPIEDELFAVVLCLKEVSVNEQENAFSLRNARHGHRSMFKAYSWEEEAEPPINPLGIGGELPLWGRLKRQIVPMSRIRPAAVVPVLSGDDNQNYPVKGEPNLHDR